MQAPGQGRTESKLLGMGASMPAVVACVPAQARCAAAARAAEAAAAEREQLERKVARLEKAKETEHKGKTMTAVIGLQRDQQAAYLCKPSSLTTQCHAKGNNRLACSV